MTLGLKLGRRLIAACALDDETFAFHDSRVITSRKATPLPVLARYFQQLITQARPGAIYYYAPTGQQTLTQDLVHLLITVAGEAGIPAKPLARSDVFGSFGILPLRTRRELREHLQHLWPVLAQGKVHRQVALAEAATAALVGEMRQAWPPL